MPCSLLDQTDRYRPRSGRRKPKGLVAENGPRADWQVLVRDSEEAAVRIGCAPVRGGRVCRCGSDARRPYWSAWSRRNARRRRTAPEAAVDRRPLPARSHPDLWIRRDYQPTGVAARSCGNPGSLRRPGDPCLHKGDNRHPEELGQFPKSVMRYSRALWRLMPSCSRQQHRSGSDDFRAATGLRLG
jgi:hypothetical protein